MEKYKMYNLGEKGASGNRLSLVFKKIKRLNKNLILNGIKVVVISGHESHPTRLPSCEKELKNSLDLGMVVHAVNPNTRRQR